MANHFVQFSEVLEIRSKAEKAWIERMLEPVIRLSTGEIAAEQPTGDEQFEIVPRFVADAVAQGSISSEDCHDAGFQHEFYWEEPDPNVLLYADEYGDPWRAGYFVQQFLRQFDPRGYWTLSWAETCSKSRPGSFGGGCLIAFSDRIDVLSTSDQLDHWADLSHSTSKLSRNCS